jgi:hypothetical protein
LRPCVALRGRPACGEGPGAAPTRARPGQRLRRAKRTPSERHARSGGTQERCRAPARRGLRLRGPRAAGPSVGALGHGKSVPLSYWLAGRADERGAGRPSASERGRGLVGVVRVRCQEHIKRVFWKSKQGHMPGEALCAGLRKHVACLRAGTLQWLGHLGAPLLCNVAPAAPATSRSARGAHARRAIAAFGFAGADRAVTSTPPPACHVQQRQRSLRPRKCNAPRAPPEEPSARAAGARRHAPGGAARACAPAADGNAAAAACRARAAAAQPMRQGHWHPQHQRQPEPLGTPTCPWQLRRRWQRPVSQQQRRERTPTSRGRPHATLPQAQPRPQPQPQPQPWPQPWL